MKQSHILDDQLLLYFLNELSPPEREKVESHLHTCRRCQTLLKRETGFLQLMRNQPQQDPGEPLLEKCRNQLRNRLREEASRKARKKSLLNFGEYITSRVPVKQLATVAVVFLFGLVLGRLLPHRGIEKDFSSRDAILAIQSSMPISNFRVAPSYEKPDWIEIRFQAVQEKRLQGSLQDPDIQYALSYALMNEPKDAIRLKTVGLLEEGTQIELIQEALIHTLEKDKNPGIRLKAIKVLRTLPLNDSIKKILIYALFKDPNPGIRIEATDALNQMADPQIRSILQSKARDDEYMRALLSKVTGISSIPLSREK
jgi:hypothetical protein